MIEACNFSKTIKMLRIRKKDLARDENYIWHADERVNKKVRRLNNEFVIITQDIGNLKLKFVVKFALVNFEYWTL